MYPVLVDNKDTVSVRVPVSASSKARLVNELKVFPQLTGCVTEWQLTSAGVLSYDSGI